MKRKNTAMPAMDLLNDSLGPGKYLEDDGKRWKKKTWKNSSRKKEGDTRATKGTTNSNKRQTSKKVTKK